MGKRVKSQWVGGNLVFMDDQGNVIFTMDGVNRRMNFPATGIFSIGGVPVTVSAGQLNAMSTKITVHNDTGFNMDAGDLVYLSGYNAASGNSTVALAGLTAQATHVLTEDIDDGENGLADEEAVVSGIDTDAFGVGDLMYLDAAGDITDTAPTGADEIAQVVGVVTVDAVDGEVSFFPGYSVMQRIGTGGIQNLAVTEDKIANGAVTTNKVEDGAVTKSKAGNGIIKTVTEVIDASGGDGNNDFAVLPADSVITQVHVRVTAGFNGDANQTINIGIEGTVDQYLATANIETAGNNIAENDEAFASVEDSTKVPASEPTGETIRATWTNNANATAGAFRVSVSYYVEDA